MRKYKVTGMSCAACSARVEKAAGSVEGLESCAVNLLTGSMTAEGSYTDEALIAAIEKAGYGCISDSGEGKGQVSVSSQQKASEIDEEKGLITRLLSSVIFLVLLMYFSMGHNMLGLPLPPFFDNNPGAIAVMQLLLALTVMIINGRFFISGAKSIMRLSPNMDALVAIGSGASFVYSTVVLLIMCRNLADGDVTSAHELLHGLYFESAAMILALITVGKSLEAKSKRKTGDALRSLTSLAPEKATILRDGIEYEIPIEDIKVGDIFLVRPGEQVPTDGFITEGKTAINEAAITGESVPSEKKEGDTVVGATLNTSGFIKCRATRVGSDTILSKIIETVNDAASTKAPIAKAADKVAAIFVPAVMGIALITAIVWLFLGETVGFALARAVSVLVISCPCSLGLATPVAIMVGSGVGAKNGILFKSAEMLEITGRTKTVVLDKTGTVTSGNIEVAGIAAFSDNAELLGTALALEEPSEHPLAGAVVRYCRKKNVKRAELTDFSASVGSGVCGNIGNEKCLGGRADFLLENGVIIPQNAMEKADEMSKNGFTPLFFSKGERLLGIIAASDTVKADSTEAVGEMTKMGLDVILLSGDNRLVTEAIAKKAGISHFIPEATPDGKCRKIEELKAGGKVAMIGDGINDAPALALADAGIAIGTGTDIARDTAGVILMGGSLMEAVNAFSLSRSVLRNIRQNLFWAFLYNCIGIPIAAGALVPFGITLSPMLGALAMGLSSFCVVTNALRLNLFKPKKAAPMSYDSKAAEDIKTEFITAEEKTMEKKFNVNGMMCHHCENHVKKALEAIDGITEAIADHTAGLVTITLSKDVADDVIIKAITDEGYEVVK